MSIIKRVLHILILYLIPTYLSAAVCTHTASGCIQYATATAGSGVMTLAVQTNHTLILIVTYRFGYTAGDTLGLTYAARVGLINPSSPYPGLDISDAQTGGTSGVETVTIGGTGGAAACPCMLLEYENMLAVAPFDGANGFGYGPTGSGTYGSGTVTTTAANDIIIGVGTGDNTGVGFTANGGATQTVPRLSDFSPSLPGSPSFVNITGWQLMVEDHNAGAPGVYDANWVVATGIGKFAIEAVMYKVLPQSTARHKLFISDARSARIIGIQGRQNEVQKWQTNRTNRTVIGSRDWSYLPDINSRAMPSGASPSSWTASFGTISTKWDGYPMSGITVKHWISP